MRSACDLTRRKSKDISAFYCVDVYQRKEEKKKSVSDFPSFFFFPFSILFQCHRLTLDHGWHFGPGSCSTAPTASELTRGNKPADSSFTGWKPCVPRAPRPPCPSQLSRQGPKMAACQWRMGTNASFWSIRLNPNKIGFTLFMPGNV